MEQTEDHDLVILYSVIEGIRESLEQIPTEVAVDFLALSGVLNEFLGTGTERTDKRLSQRQRLLLIPRSAFEYVSLDLGEKPQDVGHHIPSILSCRSSRLSSRPGSFS